MHWKFPFVTLATFFPFILSLLSRGIFSRKLDSMSQFNSKVLNMNGLRREPVVIEDKDITSIDHYYIPAHYGGCLESLLVTQGAIRDRVEKLAADIIADYQGETVHMLCVLKGGSTFFQELSSTMGRLHDYSRKTHIPLTFDFVKVKSYDGTQSSGKVQISGCDVASFEGKHLLFVEDLVDTGLTMSELLKHIEATCRPASVRVASLLEKRTSRSCGFKADYVGFSIPDAFVVGYCMDYNEAFRDLRHLAVINDEGIRKFSKSETPL